MFVGDVNMCRSIVTGSSRRNPKKQTTWVSHQIWCQPREVARAVHQLAQRIADEAEPLEVGPAGEGDPVGLGHEARHGEQEERAEDDRVLGPGLDTDAVGRSAGRSPHDADEQGEAGGVAHHRVRLVDVAVQELPRFRHLVVDRIMVTAKRTRNEK